MNEPASGTDATWEAAMIFAMKSLTRRLAAQLYNDWNIYKTTAPPGWDQTSSEEFAMVSSALWTLELQMNQLDSLLTNLRTWALQG